MTDIEDMEQPEEDATKQEQEEHPAEKGGMEEIKTIKTKYLQVRMESSWNFQNMVASNYTTKNAHPYTRRADLEPK